MLFRSSVDAEHACPAMHWYERVPLDANSRDSIWTFCIRIVTREGECYSDGMKTWSWEFSPRGSCKPKVHAPGRGTWNFPLSLAILRWRGLSFTPQVGTGGIGHGLLLISAERERRISLEPTSSKMPQRENPIHVYADPVVEREAGK